MKFICGKTEGFGEQAHNVIRVVRNGTYRFSVSEALNTTSTGVQREIHSLRNQFIVFC
jgi:hypothetical protein